MQHIQLSANQTLWLLMSPMFIPDFRLCRVFRHVCSYRLFAKLHMELELKAKKRNKTIIYPKKNNSFVIFIRRFHCGSLLYIYLLLYLYTCTIPKRRLAPKSIQKWNEFVCCRRYLIIFHWKLFNSYPDSLSFFRSFGALVSDAYRLTFAAFFFTFG